MGSLSDRQRDGPQRRATGTAKFERGGDEGKFVHLILGQFLQLQLFEKHDTAFGQQVGVHGHPIVGTLRGKRFQAEIVGSKEHDFLLINEPSNRLETDARVVVEVFCSIVVVLGLAGPDENAIVGLAYRREAALSPLRTLLEVVGAFGWVTE